MNKSAQKNKVDQPIWEKYFLFIFAGILIAINLFQFRSVQETRTKLERLENQKMAAQARLQEVKKDQRTGMLAASILNEQEGWNTISPVAVPLLDYFSRIPKELHVSSIFLDRPLLLRPLPKEQKSAFFNSTLALGGISSIRLSEIETGQAKYVIPRFFEDTCSTFNSNFTLNRAETETGELMARWLFSTEWPLQLLWKENPLNSEQEGDINE